MKRITAKIVIDGVLDDEDREAAEPVGDFKFPRWTEREKEQTKVKMLWDDQFLHVSFTCEDKHMKLTTIFYRYFLLIYFPSLSFAFETLTTVYFESSAS